MTTLKFGFKKTITHNPLRNRTSQFRETKDDSQNEVKEYVHSIQGTQINGRSKKEEEVKELVIPMIHKNTWRRGKYSKESTVNSISSSNGTRTPLSEVDRTLETQAVNEILESAKLTSEKSSTASELAAIPLLFQNRIPDGYETEDKLDVSLRAEESTLEDYERIPINQFGLAMLRGMGWNKSEGIGLKNKKVVDVKEPQVRPRGLGLGAERPSV